MIAIGAAPLSNCLGFLALGAYIFTLMPTNLIVVFPQAKQTSIPKWLFKSRRVIGILAFCLALLHGLLLIKKREFDFFDPLSWTMLN